MLVLSQSPEVPKASIRSKESSKSVYFVWDVVVLFFRNNTLARLEKVRGHRNFIENDGTFILCAARGSIDKVFLGT